MIFIANAKNQILTTDAVDIMHRRYFERKPKLLALLEQERVKADVAQKVYDLRIATGLTQQQLAERVGTTASVICRLEDANYSGHSLTMLQRIAAAVGKRVEVNFVPSELTAAKNTIGKRVGAKKAKRKPAATK